MNEKEPESSRGPPRLHGFLEIRRVLFVRDRTERWSRGTSIEGYEVIIASATGHSWHSYGRGASDAVIDATVYNCLLRSPWPVELTSQAWYSAPDLSSRS